MLDQIQKRALESLLAEDDPRTRELVVSQLSANRGEKYESVLMEFSHSENIRVRENAVRILTAWGAPISKEDLFLQSIQKNPWQRWEDLEQFCWDLCAYEHDQFDKASCARYLDEIAERVQDISTGNKAVQQIAALRQVLAKEEGFHGNVDDYYNPANSYLDTVIEKRRGLPLTVSLVYIFVGRRLGWNVYGIGVPSHYLAAINQVVFDPFHGGVILDETSTLAHYKIKNTGSCCLLSFEYSPYETAKRIVANLLKAYALLENEGKCAAMNRVLDTLLAEQDK